ncbi:TlpA family protein disulfide reductase, partial [Burkholderia latens]
MTMKRMLAVAVVAAAAAVAGGLAAGHWFRGGSADDGVAVAAPAAHG